MPPSHPPPEYSRITNEIPTLLYMRKIVSARSAHALIHTIEVSTAVRAVINIHPQHSNLIHHMPHDLAAHAQLRDVLTLRAGSILLLEPACRQS